MAATALTWPVKGGSTRGKTHEQAPCMRAKQDLAKRRDTLSGVNSSSIASCVNLRLAWWSRFVRVQVRQKIEERGRFKKGRCHRGDKRKCKRGNRTKKNNIQLKVWKVK
jgi:hypothetical protein